MRIVARESTVVKTHLSRALVDAKRKAEVEGNNARKIYRAGESKSFYRGAASAALVPRTIIIIKRDNEAHEKDGSTKRARTFDQNNRLYVDFVASQ